MTIEASRAMSLLGLQFRSLADELERQGEAIADQPSLCDGWTVANVVAHVTMAARYDPAAFGKELEAAGFDFDALSNTVAHRDGQLPLSKLLADLRSDTMATWIPPGGGGIGALSHVVIHSLDITVPNSLARTVDDAAIALVLRAMTEGGLAERFGRTAKGHLLVATDLDFTSGHGSPIRATAADLVLALANRPRPGLHVPEAEDREGA